MQTSPSSSIARQNLAKLLRQHRGVRSQRAFAAELGISYTCLQKWEKGLSFPNVENLHKLADYFGFENMDAFLGYLNQATSLPLTTAEDDEALVAEIISKIRHLPLRKATRVIGSAMHFISLDTPEEPQF
ncbi:MAG: hypothetical protein KatS3mg067_1608 [Thermosynechococcus sp.]|uniref:helix-turn-helix domain-containing protein n=1 Tax=Thermosynechococcus sp. TaxID=2814275 RepID=UPI0021FBA177|nr:helix-turn-helix transcriptional regulator [Thermosynechococcus sp.]BCX12670.1 MAG: hypothetical protein KatS3mg067_1608 [Thermosynechococcus sp.]